MNRMNAAFMAYISMIISLIFTISIHNLRHRKSQHTKTPIVREVGPGWKLTK